MEIYLVIPEHTNDTNQLFNQCKELFSRQKEKVFIRSSFNERCISYAREIALWIGVNFDVNHSLIADKEKIEYFSERSFWPTYFIEIIVAEKEVVQLVAKLIDPDGDFDNIPVNTLFRLKDVFPKEEDDEEDEIPHI